MTATKSRKNDREGWAKWAKKDTREVMLSLELHARRALGDLVSSKKLR